MSNNNQYSHSNQNEEKLSSDHRTTSHKADDIDKKEHNRTMTAEEMGRKGGEATAATHGREFYQEIGHKGGEVRAEQMREAKIAKEQEEQDTSQAGSNNQSDRNLKSSRNDSADRNDKHERHYRNERYDRSERNYRND